MARTKAEAKVDAVIQYADKIFFTAVYEALDSAAFGQIQDIRTEARKMGREFFRTLARDYMSVPAPGPFRDAPWADLSPKWDKRKKFHNRRAFRKIYYGISPQLKLGRHLRQEISSKNANVLFGSPKVRVKAASDMTGIQGKVVPLDSMPGRFQYAAGSTRQMPDGSIKKIGGQFVTPTARVTVELFPKIVNLTSPEIFEAMRKRSPGLEASSGDGEDGGSRGNWIQRLAGNEFGTALGGRVPARPLLAPFMRWWLDNEGYRRMEEALRK